MWLIAYYVVFMILGDLAAYLIELVSEREFGSQAMVVTTRRTNASAGACTWTISH